jgi:exodeoxyribonuclease VII large subunit
LLNPSAQIDQQRHKLRAMAAAMTHANRAPLTQARHQLDRSSGRLGARKPEVSGARSVLANLQHRAAISVNTQLSQRREALAALASQLELLNPQRTLERGYAIVTDEAGAVMRAPSQLKPHSSVTVRLAEGSARIGINSVD